MKLNTAIFKNKYVVAAIVAVAVAVIWYAWRSYNTQQAMEELGLLDSDISQYQGTPQYEDAPNWDGYQAGDPLPETVKQ